MKDQRPGTENDYQINFVKKSRKLKNDVIHVSQESIEQKKLYISHPSSSTKERGMNIIIVSNDGESNILNSSAG